MSKPTFMFDAGDPAMQRANQEAQVTFRYFWREVSWERRRIVPGLGMSVVKLPFTDGRRKDGKPEYEQMWVENVSFDGDTIRGNLLNSPNWLRSVKEGDAVSAPFEHLSDWMFTANDIAYGAYTVNVIRSRMKPKERAQHDGAWGLDFGDPATNRVEIPYEPQKSQAQTQAESKPGFFASLFGGAKSTPPAAAPAADTDGIRDHPMSINMGPKIESMLKADVRKYLAIGEDGWSMLHHESLAGNVTVVKLLIAYGADVAARTPNGYTATDLARKIGWTELADLIPKLRQRG